jgi:NTP pyrophosphatase (non-canonical NTP hydrolase)
MSPEWDRRMAAQKAEFDAMAELAKQWRRLELTAVVDDDYPQVRHEWESALSAFIEAMQRNRGMTYHSDFMVRLHEQNASRSKRWHPSGLVSWSLSDWFTALAGEVGELGNVVKKLNRARDGLKGNKETREELRSMLVKEAADIFIYLELFAQVAEFDLMEATVAKFNEVSERNGFPERL